MSTYRMSGGTIVKTENATASWEETTHWDGRNHISNATGTQFDHQKLYRSRKGRYYLEYTSQWQGSQDSAEWVSSEEACRWLLTNEIALPSELALLADELTE